MRLPFRDVCSFAVFVLALWLRLQHIDSPVLDRPAWRQGDCATIARNFAIHRFNIFYPQLDDEGPLPHDVELEAQIVPFLAASLYKIFGVHEVFGRLISILFSLGTIGLLIAFGQWLFRSEVAGLGAALAYAIMPGSIYYGRTFMPESAMVFFSTAAIYLTARLLTTQGPWSLRAVIPPAVVLGVAFLSKPVSILIVLPLLALIVYQLAMGAKTPLLSLALLTSIPIALFVAFDSAVVAHANAQWMRSIVTTQIWPNLVDTFQNGQALHQKVEGFVLSLAMLRRTMIGPAITVFAALGVFFGVQGLRNRVFMIAWILSGLAYIWIVVTVERVDYYLMILLPPAALAIGALCEGVFSKVSLATGPNPRFGLALAGLLVVAAVLYQDLDLLKPYYVYSAQEYRDALTLDSELPRDALVAIDRSDPALFYYIHRRGWTKEAAIWSVPQLDEAIGSGADYFIDVDNRGLRLNADVWARVMTFKTVLINTHWTIYRLTDASSE